MKSMQQHLYELQHKLARAEALPMLVLLGVITGTITGIVIIAFRQIIEGSQHWLVPGTDGEGYELLAWQLRLLLPIAGGLIIGLLLHWAGRPQTGVVHVMERLQNHQGLLPFRNALAQFIGAALSIASGHSVGREGPAIHLGATSGSIVAQKMHLPNNTTRTLVACGVAAAIGASFNTPLAGVIFAMEVIVMEYTIAGFAPVILASVCATVISQTIYGTAPAFAVPEMVLGSLTELPYVVVCGLVFGTVAALFYRLLLATTIRAQAIPIVLRTTLAGVIIGLLALLYPEIMGIGYDTVNQALAGKTELYLLLGIALAKLLATTSCLGLGIPGGLIGPLMFIGAVSGSIMGIIAHEWVPQFSSSPGFYALLGMGALMGASLHAPLAALTALLELTANPNVLLPGMLAIITAGLVNSELFGSKPMFVALLQSRGFDYSSDPVAQKLRRLGVFAFMDSRCVTVTETISRQQLLETLAHQPHWLVVPQPNQTGIYTVIATEQLTPLLDSLQQPEIVLTAIEQLPKQQAISISHRATLYDCLLAMDRSLHPYHPVCIQNSQTGVITGVINRSQVEQHYQYR